MLCCLSHLNYAVTLRVPVHFHLLGAIPFSSWMCIRLHVMIQLKELPWQAIKKSCILRMLNTRDQYTLRAELRGHDEDVKPQRSYQHERLALYCGTRRRIEGLT